MAPLPFTGPPRRTFLPGHELMRKLPGSRGAPLFKEEEEGEEGGGEGGV